MGVDSWRTRVTGNTTTTTPTPISPNIQGEGVMVIVTLGIAFTIMAFDWAPSEIVFTVANSLFNVAGITTDSQAASGYGNTGLLTVVFLYCVAEGIYQTGILEGAMVYVLGRSRSPFWGIVRVCIPVMAIAAFLNNTPIVALMTPILIAWARRSGVPVKKVLIPMAFSATLGGTCTLIGTSTNLIIAGQQAARYKDEPPFGIFDIAPYGVPYALWGFLFMALTQHWLLPGNTSKHAKELLTALRVTKRSTILGQSLLDSGLLAMQSIKLVGYSRGGHWHRDPSADHVFHEDDVIYLVGELVNIEFYAEDFCLVWLNHRSEDAGSAHAAELARPSTFGVQQDTQHYDRLVQVTVTADAPIRGKAIRSANLREEFGSVVVAFQREKEVYGSSIGGMVLRAGDILVLNADEDINTSSPTFSANFSHIHHLKEGAAKEFITAFTITAKSAVAGKTMREAGLRGLPGLHAFALNALPEESSANSAPSARPVEDGHIPPDYILQEGDTVWFAADLLAFQFLRKLGGLQLSVQNQVEATRVPLLHREQTQAVVAAGSHLAGRTLGESNFRQRFGAAVVAIAREGKHQRLPPAKVVVQAGDVLLLESRGTFAKTHTADSAFSLLVPVKGSSPPKKNKGWIAVSLGTAMVLTQVVNGLLSSNSEYVSTIKQYLYRSDLINLWPASVMTVLMMLVTRCLTCKQATDSIMWDVYLTVSAAFGVSVATEASGVAKAIADLFVSISNGIGGTGAALTAIYLATALLSEVLTNNAAGAVMYPIAAEVGDLLGIPVKSMSVAVMLGASAAWINPYGYQCNLMVYTAGNYTFKEFALLGIPFQIYLAVVAGFILFHLDQWSTVLIVTISSVAAVLGIALGWALLPRRHTLRVEIWVQTHILKPLESIPAVVARFGKAGHRSPAPAHHNSDFHSMEVDEMARSLSTGRRISELSRRHTGNLGHDKI